MPSNRAKVVILMAEDDEDDCRLVQEALVESLLSHDLRCVNDGEEMMDYLHRRGNFMGVDSPRPDLIVLDLNMPVKDGRDTLRELKEDPEFNNIPVVVLTESSSPEDRQYCYTLGAQSFYTKAVWFEDLMEIIKANADYWLDIVTGRRPHWRSQPAQ
jgi:CheY-like chemotaxis protein